MRAPGSSRKSLKGWVLWFSPIGFQNARKRHIKGLIFVCKPRVYATIWLQKIRKRLKNKGKTVAYPLVEWYNIIRQLNISKVPQRKYCPSGSYIIGVGINDVMEYNTVCSHAFSFVIFMFFSHRAAAGKTAER